MTDTPLITTATQWVNDHYPYGPHLTQSLVWLDRLAPGSREAVRLATLTHDMERGFPGTDQPLPAKLNDYAYYKAHSERSARIVGNWLHEQRVSDELLTDVEALILVHEFGGWHEANLVQAADSVSFLETNIDLFLGLGRKLRYPLKDIGIKFQRMFDRIQIDEAKTFAKPFLESAQARLAALEVEMSASVKGSSR